MYHAIYRVLLKTTTGTVAAALMMLPPLAVAQDVSGQARAVQTTVAGMTGVLADTGTLSGEDDARNASQLAASVPNVGSFQNLHAATVSSVYGWDSADFVLSEASLSNLNLGIGGNAISADFIRAEALAPVDSASSGTTSIEELVVNGSPVDVTGAANQSVWLPGGELIINEQRRTADGGMAVNALRVVVDGVADVVLASATAGADSGSSTTDSDSGLLDPLDPLL